MFTNGQHAACFRRSCSIVVLVLTRWIAEGHALTFEEAVEWLEKEAHRVAQGSILSAHDGTTLYTPDGSAHYRALWTRDFFYLLEGCPDCVSPASAQAAFVYLARGQREDGAMPDRVQADGLAVYKPGPVGQGIGPLPATDNPSFMVKLAYLISRRSSSRDLFLKNRDALTRGLHYPRKSPDGLLWIDPEHPHSPYGFTDTIFKTGEIFFSSVLQWEAYRHMAEMEEEVGEIDSAQQWKQKAANIRRALQKFWNEEEGMFHAATVDCNQIDVWGSAYAVYSGLATPHQAERVARYLVAHHEGLTQHGQIRHCAPGEYWEKGLTPKDRYQNGGYWATPFGWWFVTVHRIDPDLAKKTFVELVEDFQRRGINEWVLDDRFAVPDYVASACQPLTGLGRLGYLGGGETRTVSPVSTDR